MAYFYLIRANITWCDTKFVCTIEENSRISDITSATTSKGRSLLFAWQQGETLIVHIVPYIVPGPNLVELQTPIQFHMLGYSNDKGGVLQLIRLLLLLHNNMW